MKMEEGKKQVGEFMDKNELRRRWLILFFLFYLVHNSTDLRQDLKTLHKQMEASVEDLEREQKAKISGLENKVEDMKRIRERDQHTLTVLRGRNIGLHKELQALLDLQRKSGEELASIEDGIHTESQLVNEQLIKKEELERQLKEVQGHVTEKTNQLVIVKDLLKKATEDLASIDEQLITSDGVVTEHSVQYDELSEMAQTLDEVLGSTQDQNNVATRQYEQQQDALREDFASIKSIKKETKLVQKQLDKWNAMVAESEEEHRRFELKKTQLVAKVESLKQEQLRAKFKIKAQEKQMDASVREREVLAHAHNAKLDETKKQETALKISRSTLKNIKNEYQGYLVSIRELSKVIDHLRRDKAAHEQELSKRKLQKAQAEEEVVEREMRIADMQKKISDNEAKIKQQKALLESVKTDRNMYSKTLVEQKGEMKEYKRKFSGLTMQIKQLKQEISEKDVAFITEHLYYEHVKADINVLKVQNDHTTERIGEMDEVIRQQHEQIAKLSTIIVEADNELQSQKKHYNAVVNEQKLLNSQLIERNEELATLYEQLKLQASILTASEAHYKSRVKAINDMKQARDDLLKALDAVDSDHGSFEELKKTIDMVQHELINEQLRAKALSDELHKSVNIHRWRQLKDTDSGTFAMIQKVQQLQKDIIAKHDEVVAKEKVIEEKEQLYVELRRVLARQPGSEIVEQIHMYESTLKDKRGKLRAMKAELAMFQAKVKECQYDIEKIDNEMRLLKLDYFQSRREESQLSRRGTATTRDRLETRGSMQSGSGMGFLQNGVQPLSLSRNDDSVRGLDEDEDDDDEYDTNRSGLDQYHDHNGIGVNGDGPLDQRLGTGHLSMEGSGTGGGSSASARVSAPRTPKTTSDTASPRTQRGGSAEGTSPRSPRTTSGRSRVSERLNNDISHAKVLEEAHRLQRERVSEDP